MEKPHKQLVAWQVAMEAVLLVYRASERFPPEERYGLKEQVRRAVVSIVSNVAEGAARQTKREFTQYLHMAQASLSEVDTQMEIARRLGYLDEADQRAVDGTLERLDKLLSGLIRAQRKRPSRLPPHDSRL
ncbi:MAG: four helix bundle protein [Nitrospira sp.]|nr:four helix bundle protein [Nitrospira sp.]MCP9442069.1 four helix bundle protein [Nitrospira sp.]